MSTNIRIIKRTERNAKNEAAQKNRAADSQQTARQAARDFTGHVTTWIKEFQERRTPDPRRAFASLFVDPATSSIN
jgi:hypothetical protein